MHAPTQTCRACGAVTDWVRAAAQTAEPAENQTLFKGITDAIDRPDRMPVRADGLDLGADVFVVAINVRSMTKVSSGRVSSSSCARE
jgi:hypothetical protein